MKIRREIQEVVCRRCGYDHNSASQIVCSNCNQPIPFGAQITKRSVEMDVKGASLGRRFTAYIVDYVVMSLIMTPVGFLFGGGLYISIAGLFSLVYLMGFWVLNDGQTPGKMAVNARIVNSHGGDITWIQAFLRAFGYYVSAIPFFLGFIWIMIDRQDQGWHDKLAGTYVISEAK